ncbi:MAG: chemotaxis protein CheW [Bacteroidota bacterium]|nr:chemotaxis protein CheW [Bacteroidota bacterium]
MNDLNSNGNQTIVLFRHDELRYALYLSAVQRVVSTVEITPLPKAPEIVMGIVNFHGEIIPVINIRKRFNLPEREIELDDQLIIARTSKRLVGLLVDSVSGVHELEHYQLTATEGAFPYADYLSGIAKVENNIVLIHDLEKFLSLDEQQVMDEVLSTGEK